MKKILIAEDEVLSAKILKAIVDREGYKVVDVIKNGDDVVESFLKNKPDLLLMDILLQGKSDGISAVEEIRKYSDVPVIYITSFSDKPTINRAKKTAPVEYLTKPVDSSALVHIMKNIFDQNLDNDSKKE
jgi:CheY-like chemotaxis protein